MAASGQARRSGDEAAWLSPIVFGAIVGAIALVRPCINARLGIWLLISAFWLADSSQASRNNWVMGMVVFVLAVCSATAGEAAKAGLVR